MGAGTRNRNRSRVILVTESEIANPELIFGLVGPIGVDLDSVMASLEKALLSVGYRHVHHIHLTDYIRNRRIRIPFDESSYFSRYKSLIAYGNAFRRLAKTKSAVAGVAIAKIREIRKSITGSEGQPALGHAMIVRQFKRPEEVDLMRSVYGAKFLQVSVCGSTQERRRVLIDKIRAYDSAPKADADCERHAIELIDIDYNQRDDKDGQRLSDVFHLGDVFVAGIDQSSIDQTISRFTNAMFGDTSASPTKDEYGLYTATAAALRSVDLSRQVGAAIFSKAGDVISLGCNEVPRPGGGTYWCDDPPPIVRDVELGKDPNRERQHEIIYDFIKRMSEANLLSQKMSHFKENQKRVDVLMRLQRIKDSQVMDILEFGRIIHAEMCAISDAARLGRPTAGSTLYCTTFPCHLCTKHIVASGIDRVVFLEPYPKSLAQKLHADSITYEDRCGLKVLFQPFVGISPRRYRDIFDKKRRKDGKGRAVRWYFGNPQPMIQDRSAAYIENEEGAMFIALKQLYARYSHLGRRKTIRQARSR
jgi:deoxycytidylate deaminase